jgi:hypothetical protein
MSAIHRGIHTDFTTLEVSDGEWLSEATRKLAAELLKRSPQERQSWQSQDISEAGDSFTTYELNDVSVFMKVPHNMGEAQALIRPDLPWAEEHFQERVCGEPLNPPPSHVNWPYHAGQQDKHLTATGNKFDHTYPERFWPKRANPEEIMRFENGRKAEVNCGIRYPYGDLDDVITLLLKDITTRQAYLPIFFPEDTGSVLGQRVPCTLGYHFICQPYGNTLNIKYYIRSCDLHRHFTNDVYFTHRLLQHVCERLSTQAGDTIYPGTMSMHISNLHLFKGNAWRYQ